jgi:hypothetical protein
MKKFIILYCAPVDAITQMAGASEDEQAKGMEAWMVWAKKCGAHLVDLGAPLMNGKSLLPGGVEKTSNKEVTGYSVVQANDQAEAVDLLNNHPHLMWHPACSIEILETMPIPGM